MKSSDDPGRRVDDDVAEMRRALEHLTRDLQDLQARVARLEAGAVRTRPTPDTRPDGSDGSMYLPGKRDDMP